MDDAKLNNIKRELETLGAKKNKAQLIATNLIAIHGHIPDYDCWQQISQLLTPNDNYKIHAFIYNLIYKDRNDQNPGPCWIPTNKFIANTNIYTFMQQHNFNTYSELHTWSYTNYKSYWRAIIKILDIKFNTNYQDICDDTNIEKPNWLIGAQLNIVDNCFNVANKNKPAVIWQEENNAKINTTTYANLERLTNKIANSLTKLNLKNHSAIAIDMPMTIHAVAIYLGIIRAGHTVVSIADSFAAEEIKVRLDITQASLIFTQDYIIRAAKKLPLYQKVIDASAPTAIVIPANNTLQIELRRNDLNFQDFLQDSSDTFISQNLSPHDHINILFSSGTTSTPKAIPWDHTSAIKVAHDGYMHLDITHNDTVAWPTNLGWMMGPWLIFATLINKATMALYYGAPNNKEFVEFIQNSKTTILGVVPSIVKNWKNTNLLNGINFSNIKLFASTGEASNKDDMLWLSSLAFYKPIIEYCGGTEISGGYITSTVIEPNIPATFSTPALGLNIYLLDENGNKTTNGEVTLVPPSIGLSRELLNKDHHQVYYAGMPKLKPKVTLRRHGDQIERLTNGYYRALGRADDAMNLGGIKISSAEIERTLIGVDKIAETAAIGVNPKHGGPTNLIIYAVASNSSNTNTATPDMNTATPNINMQELKSIMQKSINTKLNPLFKIHEVILIDALPRTSSNKIMRRTLRDKYQESNN